MRNAWVLSYPLSAQRRLWSDWADAQADLSLRWANSHFVGFVVSRLILCYWSILMFNIVNDKPSIRTTLKKYCLKVVLLFFFFFFFFIFLLYCASLEMKTTSLFSEYIAMKGFYLQNCSVAPYNITSGWVEEGRFKDFIIHRYFQNSGPFEIDSSIIEFRMNLSVI